MCGIVGYIGKKSATPILIEGLRRESYRGYDSSGLVVFNGKKPVCVKAVGKLEKLEEKLNQERPEGNLGLGHCLPPDTLIQLADGKISEISNITGEDQILSLNPDTLKFSTGKVKILKHRSPEHLYKIRTSSTSLETTAEHKMMVFADGKIKEKTAEALSEGDLLIFPKKININQGEKLKFQEVFAKKYYKMEKEVNRVIKNQLTERELSVATVASSVGVSRGYIDHVVRNDRNFREDQLQKILPFFAVRFPSEYFIPQDTIHGKFIRLPRESSPELMQVIGYFLGDGHAGKRNLRFKDMDSAVLKVYQRLIEKVFNIKGRIVPVAGTTARLLEANSRFLSNWFKENISQRRSEFLNELGKLPTTEIAAFLRGLFDAEGTISTNAGQISLTMTDKKTVKMVQFLFLRFGILSSISVINRKEKNWNTAYRISFSNYDSTERFINVINFSSPEKRKKARSVLKNMKGGSVSFKTIPLYKKEIRDICSTFIKKSKLKKFLGGNGNPDGFITEATLIRLIDFLKEDKPKNPGVIILVDNLSKFLNGDVVFQPIVEKKKIKSSYIYLYDLQIDSHPNFIADCLLSHNCRWATHGEVTEENAHPHHDCQKNIFLVHNGIIENYKELKEKLMAKGHNFTSQTDTEVLSHLIEQFFQGNLETAVRKALRLVKGTYGLAVISKEDPNKIVAARMSSPLVIAVNSSGSFVASDPSAIISHSNKMVFLEDGEIAVITPEDFSVTDLMENRKEKEPIELEWTVEDSQKGGYPHFMLKEIMEQPESLENSLRGRIILEEGKARLGGLVSVQDKLREMERINIVACGTANYASLVGEYMLEEYAGIPCEVDLASEFRYRKPVLDKKNLVIAVSQSGETADTLGAIKEAKEKGLTVIGIVNTVGSSIARETEAGIYNHAGPEIGVASTKAFTSQLEILALLTLYLGRQRGLSLVMGQRIAKELSRIPDLVRQVLAVSDQVEKIAEKYKDFNNFLFLGRKYNYPIALEGALKLKEISYIHAEGYGAGEMKHGPLALVDENFPTIAICPSDSVYEKMLSNIEEIKARKGKVIAIATEGNEEIKELVDDVIYIPKTLEMLTPILSVVPLQLFAYYVGVLRGCDVDRPKNLAKSVTVE